MRFRGAHEVSIDAKGRMAIPARYRDEINSLCGGEIIVTVDYAQDNYLLIYPRPKWEKVEMQLLDLPNDPELRMVQRRMLGYALETTMDAQGRILISGFLRKEASIEKKGVLIGQGERFELWDEASWADRCTGFTPSENALDKLSELRL